MHERGPPRLSEHIGRPEHEPEPGRSHSAARLLSVAEWGGRRDPLLAYCRARGDGRSRDRIRTSFPESDCVDASSDAIGGGEDVETARAGAIMHVSKYRQLFVSQSYNATRRPIEA